MDPDTGETTLNISNSILICDVSGQLVMTNVITLLWPNESQGIFSVLIFTSPTLPPLSHSKAQFLLGTSLDGMFCEICHACDCSITEFYFLAFAGQLQGSFFFILQLHSVSTKHSQLCTSWFWVVRVCSTRCHLLSSFRKKKPQNGTFVERELRGHMVWWGLQHERSWNRPS